MRASGAWLPAKKVEAAAKATIAHIRSMRAARHEAAKTRQRWGAYEGSEEERFNDLFAWEDEIIARRLQTLAAVANEVFVSAEDFSPIARHYDADK